MKVDNSLPSRVIQIALLVSVLACPALAGTLDVTPIPASQTFVEQPTNPLTTVTFAVTNNTGTDLILDMAAWMVAAQADPEDQVLFNGTLTAPLFIMNGQTGNYTFELYNPLGDPTDCCDNGINPIAFYIEMSPMGTKPTKATVSYSNYGFFVIPFDGSYLAPMNTGPTALTIGDLFACLNNPGAFPNPCPAAVNKFVFDPTFPGVVQGNPDPTVATVNVTDTPEPAALWGVGIGCAVMGVLGTIRRRRTRCG